MSGVLRGVGGRQAALGVLVACAAHFLVGVDGLGVAIALPALQRELELTPIEGQWVLTVYGLTFGGSLLLAGRLGDLLGRRRLLVVGMTVFAAASLLAGVAPGLVTLVAARALQGLGAAAAVPAALALIGSLFEAGPIRTRALSLLAALASVGIMGGMLLGGVVTELLGWRWVFLLMAPLAGAAAVAAPRALPEVRAQRHGDRLDGGGAVLITVAGMATIFGVTRIEHAGLAAVGTVAPLTAGLLLLAVFVGWERRASAPLLPARVLRVRSLRTATLGVGVNAVAFTAIVYVGTLYLQGPLGYSPLEAGLALLPVVVVAFVISVAVGGAIARRPPRTLLAGSFALTALALVWLARVPVPARYATDVLAPLVVLGASLSVAYVVLTQEAVADVDGDDKGLASGVFKTANHLFGGAIGVAVYATVLTSAAATPSDVVGHRAAFLTATALAAVGLAVALQAHGLARDPGTVRASESRP